MSYETYEPYYQYDDSINLDNASLYDYVAKMDQLDKFRSVGPKDIDNFGRAMEPFKPNNDKDNDKDNENDDANKINASDYLIYFIIAVVIFLFVFFMMKGGCKKMGSAQLDYDAQIINLSPEIGQEYKAIFVR